MGLTGVPVGTVHPAEQLLLVLMCEEENTQLASKPITLASNKSHLFVVN